MTINNLQMQYAIRTQLLTMQAATTGSTTLGATGEGFTRASGSFITDGFEPGMEVSAAGFSAVNNRDGSESEGGWVVTQVEALTLHVDGLSTQAAASGRTVTAGPPSQRAWENIAFEPTRGVPFIEEQYLSGPSTQTTVGTTGACVQVDPLYVVNVFTPEDLGMGAPNRYADAVLAAFKSNTSFNLTNGDALRVRTDTGPFRGQLTRRKPGWAVVPVTIPLRLYTLNQ